jgi:hypothetical protein
VQCRVLGEEPILVREIQRCSLYQPPRQHQRLFDRRQHHRNTETNECERLESVIGDHDRDGDKRKKSQSREWTWPAAKEVFLIG